MNRASHAVFRSKALAVCDTLRMPPDEVVAAALRFAVDHAARAGIDRSGLHASIDDMLAARGVEGVNE